VQFGIRRPETPLDDAVKRFGIIQAPFAARKYTGKSQECVVARSFCRPMTRKDSSRGNLANRRHKHIGVNVRRRAVEPLLEPYGFATLVDAWWHNRLKTD
jgi:hypothetical protein